MATAKYLKQVAGVLTEVAAAADGGGSDADKIPQLDTNGRLPAAMMPAGLGADVALIVTSENLAAGDFVNIYDNASVVTARKADASAAGKECHGFVLAAVTSPAAATVYFEGINDQLSGLVGGKYFLGTTPGAAVATAPSGSGNVVQRLGVAVSAAELNFEASQPITLV